MRHSLFRFSGNNIPHAAILIARSKLGTHAGIIYRNADRKNLEVIDFHLNGNIVSKPWEDFKKEWNRFGLHFHVILDIDDDDAIRDFANLCTRVSRHYQGKRSEHVFSYPRIKNGAVNPLTGEIDLGGAVGMSCATFVLLLLESTGIFLVAPVEEWPHRPDRDNKRHEELSMAVVQYSGMSQDNLGKVRAQLPCPRVAPEEIAGSAMFPDLPNTSANQEFAEQAGDWIINLFDLIDQHPVYRSSNWGGFLCNPVGFCAGRLF